MSKCYSIFDKIMLIFIQIHIQCLWIFNHTDRQTKMTKLCFGPCSGIINNANHNFHNYIECTDFVSLKFYYEYKDYEIYEWSFIEQRKLKLKFGQINFVLFW